MDSRQSPNQKRSNWLDATHLVIQGSGDLAEELQLSDRYGDWLLRARAAAGRLSPVVAGLCCDARIIEKKTCDGS